MSNPPAIGGVDSTVEERDSASFCSSGFPTDLLVRVRDCLDRGGGGEKALFKRVGGLPIQELFPYIRNLFTAARELLSSSIRTSVRGG
jgi:hypothetical protein